MPADRLLEYNAFDSDPWILRLIDYIQHVKENFQIRIVGICFGHQVIARALGGRVSRSEKGWEVAVSQRHIPPHKEGILRLPSNDLNVVNAGLLDLANHKVG